MYAFHCIEQAKVCIIIQMVTIISQKINRVLTGAKKTYIIVKGLPYSWWKILTSNKHRYITSRDFLADNNEWLKDWRAFVVCKKKHHQWPSHDSDENTKNYEEHYYVIKLLQTNVMIVRHRKYIFLVTWCRNVT